ncbi:hypothetical protein D3C84_397550 [compost metagenome]
MLRAPAALVVTDPDADPDLHGLAIDHERGLHGLPDHLGDLLCLMGVVAGQQQNELISRQASEKTVMADGIVDPLSQLAEERIPLAVAEVVIDALEVIEITEQQAAGAVALYLCFQLLHQVQAIGQSGEGIAPGQQQYLLLPLLAQGHLPVESLVVGEQIEGEQQYDAADPQAQQEPGAPEDPLLGGGLIEKTGQWHRLWNQPYFEQLLHDVGEAIRIHIPDLHIERLYHLLAHLQLVLHVGLAAVDAILLAQQVDGLGRVGEGVAPPLEARGPKPRHPIRVGVLLVLSGEQDIAVKIDAVVAGIDDGDRDAALFQVERLVAQVGVEDVYLAGDQIVDVDRGRHRDELAFVQPLIVESGEQLGVLMAGEHHDPFATHVRNGENAAVATGQEDGRGVLVDAGQCQQGFAIGVACQHLGVADAKVGATAEYFLNRAYALAAGSYLDVQSGLGVKPLGLGHVVADELGLMQPAQLQDDPIRRFMGTVTCLDRESVTGAKQ